MAQQWIWEALAMGKEKALKGVDTSNFDWRSVHPDFGSPLHAVLFGKIRDDTGTESDGSAANGDGFGDLIGDDVAEKQSRLALLRMAMERGADPDATAPASCDVQKFWFLEKRGQRKETKSIVFAEKSAFQCLLAAERAIKMTDAADWKEDLEAIDEAIDILSSSACRASLAVSEGVVETWERVLDDTESADVAILVEDRQGPDDGCQPTKWEGVDDTDEAGQVLVHSSVLRGASPVLRAMLATKGMREGRRKVIEAKGCCLPSLRLLLSLIYTGTVAAGEEPSAAAMLMALDLAHRWQVLHVVQMLASALQRRLDIDCLEPVMDAASRFQLPSLLSACRTFISSHASELRGRLGKEMELASGGAGSGAGGSTARAEILRILRSECSSKKGSPRPTKRSRRVL
uniref:BTB domain-containing protein n=1 Tax=Alexandrium catenella TaxID=2925 RepID=A0A7S1WNA5_ALECA|mmetsp:Transcript_75703/g.201137  ORF Transcript_75703/g.201137 Transcript_75703/m.201137 type:complete len:403 (+) Transcript_75703:102-1310(+)